MVKKKIYLRKIRILLVVLLLSLLAGCDNTVKEPTPTVGYATIHFLDVGQGLAVFVQSDGHNLLYDGGDRNSSSFVVAYLKDQGVTDIDYLISSHYDSDHLAGLIGCLNAFHVSAVIGSDYQHGSNLYQSFMDTTAAEGLTVQHPAVGREYELGSATFTVLSPAAIGENSNANSVVIKFSHGRNSFLLTGDADHNAEAAMVAAGLDLTCDVLSVAHHGSASATSYDLLQHALPEYAVISCGSHNQYGHPDRDTMDKLESMAIQVYRNDQQGTVIAASDGTAINWNQSACNDYTPGDPDDPGTQPADDADLTSFVWKSASGAKYHRIPDCGKMNPDHAERITQHEAEVLGLGRCKKCF